ncbi:hypothetical protein SAMN02746066_03531 [Anaerosporobacter mobilis DSM 15930]|uniref:Pre-peptidase C-terminal domain-containing protein n=1 Tax=Anaerosporobacter mobilis DSM 15930 TaxID=1120996 RepID=A0A1M7M0U9_9FIRM|nr:hypothetical protein [Anaerosporobacter mobilis]SHM84250.1 hypothetical protein SAMN02746066_03531 [Anaerosporobacter mobilis DSM 15930]
MKKLLKSFATLALAGTLLINPFLSPISASAATIAYVEQIGNGKWFYYDTNDMLLLNPNYQTRLANNENNSNFYAKEGQGFTLLFHSLTYTDFKFYIINKDTNETVYEDTWYNTDQVSSGFGIPKTGNYMVVVKNIGSNLAVIDNYAVYID